MACIDCIRTLRQWEGKSISEISRTMGINWRTAKKYADSDVMPTLKKRKRRRTKIAPFIEHLEAMILEDINGVAKQRRTAKTMYEQLLRLGYQGSDRTVRHWVRKLKLRLYGERQERFVRLEHNPGEAQVDFGEAWMYEAYPTARLKKFFILVMSFPHSNATVSRALPAQNAECFLSGLQSMFEEIGGVPPAIVFDNLSPAVKAISLGQRQLTDIFRAFKWHYRFNAHFCNLASPHEKGNVEKKIGYIRRNVLSPPPVVQSLNQINDILRRQAQLDLERIHYLKKVPIGELWQQDKEAFLPLPSNQHDVFRTQVARANKVSEIQIKGHSYRIPRSYPGQQMLVKIRWDHLEVFTEDGDKIGHCPRHYAYDIEEVDWKAELKIFADKPRAVEQAVCLKAFPAVLKDFILKEPVRKRPRRIKTLIKLLDQGHGLEDLERIVNLANMYGRTDATSMMVLAGYHDGHRTPVKDPYTPEEVRNWMPDLGLYALLTGGLQGHGD